MKMACASLYILIFGILLKVYQQYRETTFSEQIDIALTSKFVHYF